MDTPDVAVAQYAARISLWALGISGGSFCVALCVFVLELRRWFDEGVRLSMSIIADAKLYGGDHQDENTYVAVTVTNRGDAATTITHMVLYDYPSRLALSLPSRLSRRFKSQRPKTFVVTNPILPGMPGQPPFVLEPGRNWQGMAAHTPELERMIKAGRLYVGVIGSHSDRTLFQRVRRWTPPKDSKAA
jgi:hypothetical protein